MIPRSDGEVLSSKCKKVVGTGTSRIVAITHAVRAAYSDRKLNDQARENILVLLMRCVPFADALQSCSRSKRHAVDDRYRSCDDPKSNFQPSSLRPRTGRSRGRFTTKLHPRCDDQGRPLFFVLTPGQAHDVKGFGPLFGMLADRIEALLANKGYDADAIRQELAKADVEAVIPTSCNRRIPIPHDREKYS